ncbi:MAG: hypothetical protein V2A61_01010 [Calditrichota bacterium]
MMLDQSVQFILDIERKGFISNPAIIYIPVARASLPAFLTWG